MNKKKIINDPVYGFITIESELIFDIIQHPWFQRLRRIKQLGLTEYVYPGALHTRFHHALGAMHLMGLALNNLRLKGTEISSTEYEAAQLAILLHDIGHGPFSHALEHTFVQNSSHEKITQLTLQELNKEYNHSLDLCIQIFNNTYPRKFFHQLVSGQLDIDRLDYLKRDGFYTGVSEGTIGSDRIIKLLKVINDELVVEEKGIYSLEHFLIARRVMYWQVYLHKTTVAAENMLSQTLRRAKMLSHEGADLALNTQIADFLNNTITYEKMAKDREVLFNFLSLDDNDIWQCIKTWSKHTDRTIRFLASGLLERKLYAIYISNSTFAPEVEDGIKFETIKKLNLNNEVISFYVNTGMLSNEAYVAGGNKINVLLKSGEIIDLAEASDLPNIKNMSKIVKKHYLCYPKSLYLS